MKIVALTKRLFVNACLKPAENETESDEGDGQHRETWTGKFDFFLSALGYAVGLGAVWRFPYLCYRNGGGVFLIPYFIFMALVGIPLVFIELSVGQFRSTGPLTCWTMVPIFRGIGLSMNIVNSYVTIYYNMIIAYSCYYLVLSFTSKLPWETCDPSWSSPNCVDNYSPDVYRVVNCSNFTDGIECASGKCINSTTLNGTAASCDMSSDLVQLIGWYGPTTFPSQDYWNKVVLRKSPSIDEPGTIVWQLMIAMLVAWIIVFAMVIKGIQASGKIVYFTSLFPYVVLLILGIRGWLLPGADKGVEFYIKPDFSRLSDVNVWADAASQIFFTLSVAYGGLTSLASYNNFNTNIMRDAIVVSISNCLTSLFAGFVVFAYIGYLSHTTGQEIDTVIQAGQGLSFVVFPYAVTTIPGAPFWSVLFFIMMLVLGLDTQMTGVETTITSVLDIIPSLRAIKLKKYLTITVICIIYFLLGFSCTFETGTYWIEILDNYAGGWAVFIVAALEAVSIAWFYGIKNFKIDLSLMMGNRMVNSKLFYYWIICWIFVCPAYLIVLTVLTLRETKPLESGGYVYPYWTFVLGQLITVSTLCGTLFWAIGLVIDALFFHKRPLLSLFKPDFINWVPRFEKNARLMRMAHGIASFDDFEKQREVRF